MVSGETSAPNDPGSIRTAVRHTPLTAMLDPSSASVSTRSHAMRSCGAAANTWPASSTIPVNITLHREFVRSDRMHRHSFNLNRVVASASLAAHGGHRVHPAENLRRVIEEDLVDDSRIERRRIHGRAGLNQHRANQFL